MLQGPSGVPARSLANRPEGGWQGKEKTSLSPKPKLLAEVHFKGVADRLWIQALQAVLRDDPARLVLPQLRSNGKCTKPTRHGL